MWMGVVAGALLAGTAAGGPWNVRPDDPAPGPAAAVDPPDIRPTQLAAQLNDGRGFVRFRATALRLDGRGLLLLTAAHCLSRDDEGRAIRLSQGERAVDGLIRAVVHNPYYDQAPPGASPGADNALVLIEPRPADDDQRALVDDLRRVRVELSPEPVPNREGQIVQVYAIDQFEQAHALRAGNFLNPRWLEWGPLYQPVPGDSGSGVFVYRRDAEGRPRPVLIGVITDRSPRGGGASLVSKRQRWIAETLLPPARSDGP
jgi:hypothetical protein